MRSGFSIHFVLFVVVNALFAVLNLAPVDFELSRPGVPLWFLYALVPWSAALLGHAVFTVLARRPAPAASPAPAPARPARAASPEVGQAGALLAACRQGAGAILAAAGAHGSVPIDLDDLLRGAVDQAERLAERLGAAYQRRVAGAAGAEAEVARFEGLLVAIERALKILVLEAQVLGEGADTMTALAGPVEALREAILCAAEVLAE